MKLIRTHYCNEISKSDCGKTVILSGWVKSKRDHGDLIFVDIRDRSGVVQIVADAQKNKQAHRILEQANIEYVIAVEGEVVLRAPAMINAKLSSGDIEMQAKNIEVFSASLPLPFLPDDAQKIHEDLLLKHRFLALREHSLQDNLMKRHQVVQCIHRFLSQKGFIEFETPMLNKSTPEGARDFVVPSRLNHGKFYALPQSPQIFKQLLMASGFDKYYQIARCFRDEDLRADRQPEFTQVDVEMSFVTREMVMQHVEEMFQKIFSEVYQRNIQTPFPTLTYDEAIRKYGTDKPDLRFGLAISNVSDILVNCDFDLFKRVLHEGGEIAAINVKNASSLTRKDIESFVQDIGPFGGKGLVWMKVQDKQLKSNVSKHFNATVQKELIHQLKGEEEDLFLLVAGEPFVIYKSLGHLRTKIARMLNLIDESQFSFVWLLDLPLLEYSLTEQRYKSFHHPFTLPNANHIDLLDKNPLQVRSESYDLVLNGCEIGGGGLRIYDRKLQEKIFDVLGISKEEYQAQFGFFLQALEYGVPPHGGIALGLDRMIMVFQNESSIRNVIAFPKTHKGSCLMSQTPSVLHGEQLMDLNIRLN